MANGTNGSCHRAPPSASTASASTLVGAPTNAPDQLDARGTVLRGASALPVVFERRPRANNDSILETANGTMVALLEPRLYFSYSQFMVYDASESLPGCAWTEAHTNQGFARRPSAVCFRTLLEFGHADVSLQLTRFVHDARHRRVIAVPFTVVSGKVIVDGPEEDVDRHVTVEPGRHRLVAAQYLIGESERIELFLESRAAQHSEIIIADEALVVPDRLLETADIA
jgi:hypothetical protein